jgi:hypothetical protein
MIPWCKCILNTSLFMKVKKNVVFFYWNMILRWATFRQDVIRLLSLGAQVNQWWDLDRYLSVYEHVYIYI